MPSKGVLSPASDCRSCQKWNWATAQTFVHGERQSSAANRQAQGGSSWSTTEHIARPARRPWPLLQPVSCRRARQERRLCRLVAERCAGRRRISKHAAARGRGRRRDGGQDGSSCGDNTVAGRPLASPSRRRGASGFSRAEPAATARVLLCDMARPCSSRETGMSPDRDILARDQILGHRTQLHTTSSRRR